MKYKVLLITEDSEHEASSHLEDEEMLIVEDENGRWCEAGDFFAVIGVTEFETK